MSQTIQCPHCGQSYALTPEQVPQYSGQTITCTRCQKPFTVPSLAAQATPPPMQPQGQFAGQPTGQQIPYGGYAPYGEAKETNGLAIAALVCGIIALIIPIIPAILAIIFGVMALSRTKDPRVGGKGFAIAGLCVGGVAIMMNVCALSVLLPSLNRARETANRVKCASNMRQIGQGILLYSNANRGRFPDRLELLITSQGLSPQVFCCPTSGDTPATGANSQQQAAQLNAGGHLSYVYVGKGLTITAGADTVLLYENFTNHNQDGCNFLYADGHVAWESKQAAQKIIADVQAGKNPPP